MFSAPAPGPTTTKGATPFVVSTTGLWVNDGGTYDATVAIAPNGTFNWPEFKVSVSGGTIALDPQVVELVRGDAVSGPKIEVTRTPETLEARIAQGNPTNSDSRAVTWNGLVISADVPGNIIITGIPENTISQRFRVFLKSPPASLSSPVVASADFTVRVTAAGEFHLNPEAVTIPYDGNPNEVVEVNTSLTLTNLTLTRSGGSGAGSALTWNGLNLVANAANKRITITGTSSPLMSGTADFTVTGTSDRGEVRSADLRVTITEAPPTPPSPTYTLGLSPAALHPIVGKDFDRSVEVYVTSTTANSLALTSVTIDGQPTVSWNGLTLLVESNTSIRVFDTPLGTPKEERSNTFMIRGHRSDGGSDLTASLTVTVHPAEEEDRARGRFINSEGEIRVERGKSTAIKLSCLSYVTVDSVTEVNPDGKWEWIQGPTAEGVSEFYVSVYPTTTGLYTLRINYSLGGTPYYQNITYRSVRTDEEGLASSGCSVSAGSVGVLVLAALWLKRKKI
jgi:hypothetical protein